jgi:hypothetical protein
MVEDYFIGVYEPLDVRRNLLESSKQVVKSLECHEKIERIRHEKIKNLKEMDSIMSELGILSSKLRQRMPKANFRKTNLEKKEDTQDGHIQTGTKFSKELKNLEVQLKDIEKELSMFK